MKRGLLLVITLLFLASCQRSYVCPDSQQLFKAKFEATPQLFSAQGGEGNVSGVLKELSPEGVEISEIPLTKSDFTLTLKSGDPTQITIDDATKSFVVAQGTTATFELEAVVTSDKAKGEAQVLTIVRGGEVVYSFVASPDLFDAKGGEGMVSGVCKVTNASGTVVSETELQPTDFTLSLKSGNATELTIDQAKKSFSVKAADEAADFILEAKATQEGATAQEIKIHRKAKEAPIPANRLPLAYVAEYNINLDGTGFATTHATDVSGYFTFKEAVNKFSDITIADKKYHLPTKEEWMAIVPPSRATPDYVDFASEYTYTDSVETVSVGGKMITSTNDYYGTGEDEVYALRFKGTDLCSAWKYEYTFVDSHRVLRVTARPVDMATNLITIEEVKKPEFWTSNTSDDIVRVFPASGWIGLSDILYAQESLGSFWSATSYDARKSWYMVFGRANSRIDIHFAVYHYSVRLFETMSH